ncbi:signal transduction histidine kinase [Mizugakiibacter sediminis]|uniref:Signal transduction histidine kinase n=2 Tax=Mizugakiibacter sediminis TaxID=1475481 RepID=A0A0K8QLK3_9GAMM|nr:signal transduction histidine kinase [Mizugakiibacter sediminis]
MMGAMSWVSFNHIRLLRYAGLFAYVCAGIPLLRVNWALGRLDTLDQPSFALLAWVLCYLAFGLTYWLLTRNLGSRRYWAVKLFGLLVLTGTAMAVGWYSQSGLSALLLVLVSVVLPWLLPLPLGIAWMVLQNFALVPVFTSLGMDAINAFLQASLYLGFSALTFVTSVVARQQAEEREQLRGLNSELRATRALLAESSRITERMRIARELHDLVGHHLTALSLNLEVASHLAAAPAEEHVRKAQAVAKQLLGDVREVVSELRQDDALDLTQALRSLTEGVPGLAVRLELPPRFSVEDPRRAQVVLRCVQEIVTNAVRHAGARNLTLRFERTAEGELKLEARDDGRGAAEVRPGNGLTGMRERLAEFGGRLAIDTARERGFALDAWLPLQTRSPG